MPSPGSCTICLGQPPRRQPFRKDHAVTTIRAALAAVAAVLAAGTVWLLSVPAAGWFANLDKSWTTPSLPVQAVIWCLVLAILAASLGRCLRPGGGRRFLFLYGGELGLLILWSVLFFRLHHLAASFLASLVLALAVLWQAQAAAGVSRLAGRLCLPCLVWAVYAAYQNFYIFLRN